MKARIRGKRNCQVNTEIIGDVATKVILAWLQERYSSHFPHHSYIWAIEIKKSFSSIHTNEAFYP